MADKGAANAKLSSYKTLHQSVMGGAYVGFGALLSLTVAGNMAKITDGNPGLQKFIFAALFPVNLFLILTTGGQLFTGNTAAVAAAIFEGKVRPRHMRGSHHASADMRPERARPHRPSG